MSVYTHGEMLLGPRLSELKKYLQLKGNLWYCVAEPEGEFDDARGLPVHHQPPHAS